MAYSVPSRERRLLKAGHSSIAVTLPKPWAEAMNLHPGDLIVFDQNDDGTLYLKPAPTSPDTVDGIPFVVHARSFTTPGVLTRLVVGAYRVGHDAIEIRTDEPLSAERLEELTSAARRLLGVSIVAHEPTRIVLQNFIDPSKYGLPQLIHRSKMILVALLDEAEDLLGKRGRSRRLASLDEEANKVFALMVRQLFLASRDWSLARRIESPDPRQLLEWRVVVEMLEELGHIFTGIVDAIGKEPSTLPRDRQALVGLVNDARVHLKSTVDSLMRPSVATACESLGESVRLQAAVAEALQRPGRNKISARLGSSFERSASLLGSLSEVAMDRAVAMGSEAILLEAA
jgi:AbrB family looped-hinge helix DNA binding protein